MWFKFQIDISVLPDCLLHADDSENCIPIEYASYIENPYGNYEVTRALVNYSLMHFDTKLWIFIESIFFKKFSYLKYHNFIV